MTVPNPSREMKITDPSLWPPHLPEIRIEPSEPLSGREAYDVMTSDGAQLAAMAALRADDDPIAFDHMNDTLISVEGCWELTMVRADGRLRESRILFRAPEAGRPGGLDAELRAWATLTVLWAFGGERRGRG